MSMIKNCCLIFYLQKKTADNNGTNTDCLRKTYILFINKYRKQKNLYRTHVLKRMI